MKETSPNAPRNPRDLDPRELARLVDRLRKRKGRPKKAQGIPRRAEAEGPWPLAPAQERLWFLDRLEPGTATYHLAAAFDLVGQLDRSCLERAFRSLGQRHEILRTRFPSEEESGEPQQVLAEGMNFALPVIDLCALPTGRREPERSHLEQSLARRPFDLSRGSLLRAHLVRDDHERHALVLILHHIVADGWAVDLLLRELAELYGAFLEQRSPRLEPLPIQYADYAVWQRKRLEEGELGKELAYWREQLVDSPPSLDLPFDRPRRASRSSRGERRKVALSAESAHALRTLAEGRGVTPFILLLAAWNALLGGTCGQSEVVVASPVANRNRSEVEGVIGLFANTLILRTDLRGDPSFVELLDRSAGGGGLAATAHQGLPFERLVQEVDPERSLAHAPLAQVMLTLDTASTALDLPGVESTMRDLDTGTAKFDLLLALQWTSGGLTGTLEYSTDLFDSTTAERLVRHFRGSAHGGGAGSGDAHLGPAQALRGRASLAAPGVELDGFGSGGSRCRWEISSLSRPPELPKPRP